MCKIGSRCKIPDSDFLDRKHIQETFVGVYTTPLTSQPVFLLKTSAVDHLIASRGSWIGRRFRCKIHKSLGISGIWANQLWLSRITHQEALIVRFSANTIIWFKRQGRSPERFRPPERFCGLSRTRMFCLARRELSSSHLWVRIWGWLHPQDRFE